MNRFSESKGSPQKRSTWMEWDFPAVAGKPPSPRHGSTMCSLTRNKLIVFGGWARGVSNADIIDEYYNDTHLLDLDEAKWVKLDCSSNNEEFPVPRAYHCGLVIQEKLYICNGGRMWCESGPSPVFQDLWCLDIASRKWTKLNPQGEVPPAMEGHSCFDWEDKLWIFGGYDGNMNYHDLYSYDPGSNTWTKMAQAGAVPPGRCYHSTTRVGDQVYLFSGSIWEGYTGVIYEDFYVLDLPTLVWSELSLPKQPAPGEVSKPSNPCGRFAHSCALLSSNQLFVYGGWSIVDGDRSRFFGDGYLFDIVRGTWSRIPPEAESAGPGVLYGHCYGRSGNDVVFFGGRDHMGNRNGLYLIRELNSNLAIPEPKPAVGPDLFKAWKSSGPSDPTCDFELQLSNGDLLRVHKFVLSSRSEKFKALFASGLSESSQPKILITDDNFAANSEPSKRQKTTEAAPPPVNQSWIVAFHIFVEFLYCGVIDFDSDKRFSDSDVVMQLLKLSDQYLVTDLKEQLEYWLQGSIDATNAAFMFSYADECGAFRLRSASLSYIVSHYDQCRNADFWTQISRDLKNEVEANIQTRFRRRRERTGSPSSSQNGSQEDAPAPRKRKR